MSISLGIGIKIGGNGGGITPILDIYTAALAYSFRKLRTAYAGSCIKVRRSSDDATQDIGFSAGILDTASLLTFIGVGNGYIDTLYDQSGNSQDLGNPVTTKQPLIAIGGALCLYNGRLVAIFDGVDDGLYRLNVPQTANKGFIGSFFVHRNRETGAGVEYIYFMGTGTSTTNARFAFGRGASAGKYFNNGRRNDADGADIYSGAANIDEVQKISTVFVDYTNSNAYMYLNGVLDGSDTTFLTDGSTTNTNSQNISIGGDIYTAGDANESNLDFFEWIVFNTDISANRVAIEANQSNFFFNLTGEAILTAAITYDSLIDSI